MAFKRSAVRSRLSPPQKTPAGIACRAFSHCATECRRQHPVCFVICLHIATAIRCHKYILSRNRAPPPPYNKKDTKTCRTAHLDIFFTRTRFLRTKKSALTVTDIFDWCRRRDLNPHGVTRLILSQVRLPIPPLRLYLSTIKSYHISVGESTDSFSFPVLFFRLPAAWPRRLFPTAKAQRSSILDATNVRPYRVRRWSHTRPPHDNKSARLHPATD